VNQGSLNQEFPRQNDAAIIGRRGMSTPAPQALSVAIVDGHGNSGHGAADVLRDDPAGRFLVVAVVRRIADLAPSVTGAAYDVCVLDLVGVGSVREIERLLETRQVVVCTASGDWQVRVAAWARGAHAVLGQDVSGPPLAEAVWDAAHVPEDIKPQLAHALLAAADAGALPVTVRQRAMLSDIAGGLPRAQVMEAAGLSQEGLGDEITRIRQLCVRAGLDRLRLPAAAVPVPAGPAACDWPASLARKLTPREREVLELYADGRTDTEIAGQLGVRPLTVRNHMARALLRCDIHCSDRETRLWFALAVTGRHRFPERLQRRIEVLRAGPE
jgi:DNA-binding NarL/FixJ family response regulator